MIDIKSLLPDELTAMVTDAGFPRFRAGQILTWLHNGAEDFDSMTNLPADLRRYLCSNAYIASAEIARRQVSRIDGTVKYLFRLYDGEYVESVVMRYHHGVSICISTQVGCKMGCTFCATGRSGYARDLSPSEMIAQIETAQRDIGERIANVVLMGMGEPFDNFDHVIRFLSIVSSEHSLHIGMRHITISTCGIVPRIYAFADLHSQTGLSISLHSATDEGRSRTMPVNRRYPIAQLLEACRYYTEHTHRRITFEYALIDGENDSDDDARALADLVSGLLCHINLIPVNAVSGTGYNKSKLNRQRSFLHILQEAGVNATVRRTLGSDIDASCGQLKRNFMKGDE